MPLMSRPWSPRSWAVAPLAAVTFAFVAFALPPYLTLDPTRSRIPPPAGLAFYYPTLVAHVIFGSVAILTCAVQVWPWFRRRYPDVHRAIGRVYVFAGVLPAGVTGLIIGAVSPFGPTIRASNVLLAIIWLFVTISGLRAGRQRRFAEHRRWMIRSFVLTMSIVTNRVWAAIWFLALAPQLPTTFAGNEALMIQTIAGLSGWLGWTIPLVAAEWWLDRDDASRRFSGGLITASHAATPRHTSGSV